MFKSVKLTNFLSFGNDAKEIDLRPLNVLIGTNGSGKSNFLGAFDLLQNAPVDITRPIREGGGAMEWLHKGSETGLDAALAFVMPISDPADKFDALEYEISFNAIGHSFEITNEQLVSKHMASGTAEPITHYSFNTGRPVINIKNGTAEQSHNLKREDMDITQSILAQKRDAFHYPEITFLAQEFSKIKLYRDWQFGHYAAYRLPQKADSPNQFLLPDCSNLGLVLNQIKNDLQSKKQLLKELKYFYNDVEDYESVISGGSVQIYFQERGLRSSVPATRLSDGTLRYLCLLAILCHPAPPPLICIEEPELGLHPDVLPNLARLMREASERCQLIVTTHSEIFVDSFSDYPEVVSVAERSNDGTRLERLDKNRLKPWLEKYRLGQLWTRGDIGGTRW